VRTSGWLFTHSGQKGARLPRAAARWLVTVVVVIGMMSGLLSSTSASAAGFHQYSVAYETTGTGFTGVQSTHLTRAVVGQETTGCASPYMGAPVYETTWLLITSDGANFDEFGVGHQCGDNYRYYYWGYGLNNVWYSLGIQQGAVNGSNHTYQISRSFNGTNYYDYWQLDGTTKASLQSFQRGAYVSAGLESYSSPATVASYTSNTLKYQQFEGAFLSWAGRDTQGVGSSMCGSWASATSWTSGEHVAC
jgi:hypothetical protein